MSDTPELNYQCPNCRCQGWKFFVFYSGKLSAKGVSISKSGEYDDAWGIQCEQCGQDAPTEFRAQELAEAGDTAPFNAIFAEYDLPEAANCETLDEVLNALHFVMGRLQILNAQFNHDVAQTSLSVPGIERPEIHCAAHWCRLIHNCVRRAGFCPLFLIVPFADMLGTQRNYACLAVYSGREMVALSVKSSDDPAWMHTPATFALRQREILAMLEHSDADGSEEQIAFLCRVVSGNSRYEENGELLP